MVLPIFASRETTYQVAFHDYTYDPIYRNLRNLPAWLNEGLAEFYSTFSVESDGRRIIGRAPAGRLLTLRLQPMFTLSKFLDPQTVSRIAESPTGIQVFYAQAWAFVHFMMLSDKGNRQGQVLKYLEALQTAPTRADAARQAFGTDLSRLDADLHRYIERDQFPAIVVPPPQSKAASAAATVQPLSEAEALHLQGRLLVDLGAAKEAEAVLGRALSVESAHVPSRVALARVRLQQDRQTDAVEMLEAAAAGGAERLRSAVLPGVSAARGRQARGEHQGVRPCRGLEPAIT